jgi:hypothetical protein
MVSEALLKHLEKVVRYDLRDTLRREFTKWYQYMWDIYGSAKLDEWVARKTDGIGDPHWVAKTPSGYIVLHDTTNDYLFIYDPEQKRTIKKFYLGGSAFPPKAGDVYPEEDLVVFNNNGLIYEYDIKRDKSWIVADVRDKNIVHGQVIYNPRNRNELLITESGTNTLYIYSRETGALVRSVTLPTSLHWGGIVPVSFWGQHWCYQGASGFVYFVEGEGIKGDIPYMPYVGWVYAKGAFGTFGSEETYAMLTENCFLPIGTFPIRSNNVFITDQFTFILTYHLSVFEMTLRDVLEAPKACQIIYASPERVGAKLGAGEKYRYTWTMGSHVKCRVTFKTSAPANYRILKFNPLKSIYGFIWRDYSKVDTGNDFLTVYEVLNSTWHSVEIDGLYLATLEIENTGTEPIDAWAVVHCVGE